MLRQISPLVIVAAASVVAHGQVAVELLDMPSRVHSFEPVYVLYSIENVGGAPLYLPAEGGPERGPGVFFAPAGEEPRWVGLSGDRAVPHAEETAWLAPGERWLVYEDISYWLGVLEGEVGVQAVFSSDGRCGDRQIAGKHSFPLAPRRLDSIEVGVRTFPVYRCWKGEARSNVWMLTVERPDAPADRAAHEYLVREGALIHDAGSDRWLLIRGRGLEERFPSSHYTYAFLARGTSSLSKMKRAIELQPAHSLNSWVRVGIAKKTLEEGESDLRRVAPMVEGADLPSGAMEYLEQHAANLDQYRSADGKPGRR